MRMFKYIIFVYIFVYQEAILARSNALDDYWKEQDKVAFSTHQDSDGLTIVLSKKEDPIKPLKAVQNKYSHKNKNKKIEIVIKNDRRNKVKQSSFFVDQKLAKQQISKQIKLTTMIPIKSKNQFFVLEKTRLSAKKTVIKKGITKNKSVIKTAKQIHHQVQLAPARKPSEVDWLIEQEIHDSNNEYNEASIRCDNSRYCEPQSRCGEGNSSLQLKSLGIKQYFNEVQLRSLNAQWLETNTGLQIEKRCLTEYGQEFPTLLTQSITEGLSCLDSLGGEGSDFNQIALIGLLQNSQTTLKFKCENKSHQTKFSAEATIFPTEDNYPQITLKKGQKSVSKEKLKDVIFHELMHTNGYAHQADIEYMYACQDCCRDQVQNKASCNVCKNNYTSTSDPVYQKDVLEWIKEAKGSGASLMAYISTMSMDRQKLGNEIEQLIQAIKFNPAFEGIVQAINQKMKSPNNKINEHINTELAGVLLQLKQGQLTLARQSLSLIQARRHVRSASHRKDDVLHEEIEILFDQLQSQMNQNEIRSK